ncbi:hypothetical protein HQ585_13730 [candidate division KSB1 bacterium]|nr:hypothetical protein [candidate division KSB1 bacterium]
MRKGIRFTLVLLFILMQSSAFSQTDNGVQIGHLETVHSKILNEDRPI